MVVLTMAKYVARLKAAMDGYPQADLDPRIERDIANSLRDTADSMEARAARRSITLDDTRADKPGIPASAMSFEDVQMPDTAAFARGIRTT